MAWSTTPPPRSHRAMQYSAAEWRKFDALTIDPMNNEQLGMVAELLQVNAVRVHEAIAAVGPKAGDIRAWLDENAARKRRR
jgi:hypothetical protein